jgi:hypothetical protein
MDRRDDCHFHQSTLEAAELDIFFSLSPKNIPSILAIRGKKRRRAGLVFAQFHGLVVSSSFSSFPRLALVVAGIDVAKATGQPHQPPILHTMR